MTARRAALIAVVALAGLHAPAAPADDFFLTSPYETVADPPPLSPGSLAQQTAAEFRNPGRIDTREAVEVGVGPDGAPIAVSVTQRLRVTGTGDYSFVIPAPAVRLAPGPPSESLPGLRDVGILWQGFSNRRRLLAAKVVLQTARAAAALPLRVRIAREGGATVVRLENVARRRIDASLGPARRERLVRVLDGLRASYADTGRLTGPLLVGSADLRTAALAVSAPLRVSGVVRRGAASTPVRAVLGGDRPLVREIVLPGTGTPVVDLRVSLPPALSILPSREALLRGPRPAEAFQRALGAAATAWAYRSYLLAPDTAGARETTYRYRTAAPARADLAGLRAGGPGTPLVLVLVALGGVLLAGLAALWARS